MSTMFSPQKITSRRVIVTSLLVDLSNIIINVVVAVLSGSAVMFSQALQGNS